MFKSKEEKEKERLLKKDKEELINLMQDLGNKLSLEISDSIKLIEELEQDKLYFIHLKDASKNDVEEFKRVLGLIKSRMRWTIPNIFVSNIPITELTIEQLNELITAKKSLVVKE